LQLPVFFGRALTTLSGSWSSLVGTAADEKNPTLDSTTKLLGQRLEVKSSENSSLLVVRFTAAEPRVAADVVNAIMDEYVQTARTAKTRLQRDIEAASVRQEAQNRGEIAELERQVAVYLRTHNVSEVQESLTAALELAKYQEQLAKAREDLAGKKATLDTLSRNDLRGTREVLESKSIQKFKETLADLVERLATLAPSDPRRINLQNGIAGINALIEQEARLIEAALARDVAALTSKIKTLTAAVSQASAAAQLSTSEGSELKLLVAKLEAKRAFDTAFLTHSAQLRLSAEQAPEPRVVFPATPPERPVRSYGTYAALSTGLGFLVGLIGSAMLTLTRGVMYQKINTAQDMTAATGVPVAGCLPDLRKPSPKVTSIMDETLRAISLVLREPIKSACGVYPNHI